ncbi:glycosyl transferase group 1 [Cyanobacterium stanieri PCC 7202]|uniref:Glycosyl transferase group 1 n=1 Tax=Cyanobacterium stanieri (strain ATCC 29140 / PCC 7202) TaxID=292563 RepID=K9YL69_CYASC|nr:glycosyl transferase group 1 [Cyanobacterium stanieri PCC 7202]
MKILVLAWEFPPRIVGGIARHVAELYPEIVKLDHDIHLITVEFGSAPAYEQVEGIKIHRVPVAPHDHFFDWVHNMNRSMQHQAHKLINHIGTFDLIHAHDWLVAESAIALKHQYKIPLVATIHATEYGRHNGIHNHSQAYVSSQEGNLIYNAWRVIVCSSYMREEVHRAFNCPWDKIDIVYNGIRAEKKQHPPHFDKQAFRRQYAADDEKIVYYVGRMTYEKGIQVLLNAAPQILRATGYKAKFIIIGGGDTSNIKAQAARLGIWDRCYFTGFMSDEDLNKFQTIADCAVFPSLYEPFGIVALESFASRVPVVVSNTGGLPEVVQHEKTGITTYANDYNSLAWGILQVLQNPDYAKILVANAYQDLKDRFRWSDLAKQTVAVYTHILKERRSVTWH